MNRFLRVQFNQVICNNHSRRSKGSVPGSYRKTITPKTAIVPPIVPKTPLRFYELFLEALHLQVTVRSSPFMRLIAAAAHIIAITPSTIIIP
jgi:hypothetical protein